MIILNIKFTDDKKNLKEMQQIPNLSRKKVNIKFPSFQLDSFNETVKFLQLLANALYCRFRYLLTLANIKHYLF